MGLENKVVIDIRTYPEGRFKRRVYKSTLLSYGLNKEKSGFNKYKTNIAKQKKF